MFRLVIVLAAGLWLCGCASSTSVADNNDPYEATNRWIFDLNLQIDHAALRPTAEHYSNYIPENVRNAIHNALDNLNAPVTFANDVLQGETKRAGQTLGRFVINSTFGLGGLLDAGTKAGIPGHSEDFGQTLGVWGVGEGPYLVLPLLGPLPPRDAAGELVDLAADPTMYISIKHHTYWAIARRYVTIVDARARSLESLDDIERDSMDFYATTRSLYRQYRENEIRNGMPPP
jgi:phospholipid-binding lipoprotein MlaA